MDLNSRWWLTFVSQKDMMVVRNASTTELKYTVVILAKKNCMALNDIFIFLVHLKWSIYILHA